MTTTSTAHSAPLHVNRVVENDHHTDDYTHTVQVQLTPVQWRMLVGDVAARFLRLRATGKPVIATMLAAGVRPCDMDQQDALTALVALLAMEPPAFDLTPGEDLDRFIADLDDAGREVTLCACGRACQDGDTCDVCTERLDRRIGA